MDFGKAVELAEKYVREFVLYILFFFRGRETEEEEDVLALSDMNRSMVFAIMSAILGAYLWQVLVIDLPKFEDDIGIVLAKAMMRWLTLGLVLYFLMRLFGIRVHIIVPILSVFRVFSVSRIAGVGAAYVMSGLVYAFQLNFWLGEVVNAFPFVTAYAVQFFIIWIYFWRETADYGGQEGFVLRRFLATLFFILIATAVVLIPISEYLTNFVFA